MADESTLSIQQAERVDHQLIRGIGIPALTANIVSSTIGAGIFVIPATVARELGSAAPLAFVCCAVAMVLFVTCFAIAGSRVSLTGGLYAYVEVAFGRYVGFLAGMLYYRYARRLRFTGLNQYPRCARRCRGGHCHHRGKTSPSVVVRLRGNIFYPPAESCVGRVAR